MILFSSDVVTVTAHGCVLLFYFHAPLPASNCVSLGADRRPILQAIADYEKTTQVATVIIRIKPEADNV